MSGSTARSSASTAGNPPVIFVDVFEWTTGCNRQFLERRVRCSRNADRAVATSTIVAMALISGDHAALHFAKMSIGSVGL